jgi:hypothetical protein
VAHEDLPPGQRKEMRQFWRWYRRIFRLPEDLQRGHYMHLLCTGDRLFLRTLFINGALTASELTGRLHPHRDEEAARFPTRTTVDDWLQLAYRRDLVRVFEESEGSESSTGDGTRWALTEEGKILYRRPSTELRWVGAILRYGTQFIGWLAALALGSALLGAAVGRIDWGEVVSSDAFAWSLVAIIYALMFTALSALNNRHGRPAFALLMIDLSRVFGTVSSLELETAEDSASAEPARA